jgi:hypothetical protein
MSAVWLILYLGGLVHLLALYGYDALRGGGPLLLLPVVLMPLLPWASRRVNWLLDPLLGRGMGLLGFACALLFVRGAYLDAWDTWRWAPDLLAAGAGAGSLWAASADPEAPGPGAWLWIAAWLLGGFLDPALPLLGAGLAGVLAASGNWPSSSRAMPLEPILRRPSLAFLLLGLALPKPWWDFGLQPAWALSSAAFGLGGALAAWAPVRSLLARLPESLLAAAFGLLAILYWPTWALPWGAVLGLLAGSAWSRLPQPGRWAVPGLAFLGGLLLSFTLHANAWIPGLRHLIWLGN